MTPGRSTVWGTPDQVVAKIHRYLVEHNGTVVLTARGHLVEVDRCEQICVTHDTVMVLVDDGKWVPIHPLY